jgi:hypothetical protein
VRSCRQNRLGSGWRSVRLRRTSAAFRQSWGGHRRAHFTARQRREHLFFAHHQRGSVVARGFEPMPMSNCIRRAGLHAIAAEDTAAVVDVVNLRVTLRTAVPLLCCVLRCLDINAIGRTCGRAQETGNTFFEAVLVTLKNVRSPVSRLQLSRAIRVSFCNSRLEEFFERDAHSLRDCRSRADYFTYFRHASFRVTQRDYR